MVRSFPLLEISIHAPRVGSDPNVVDTLKLKSGISIHAPRVGSDVGLLLAGEGKSYISIHAPRVGSDCTGKCGRYERIHFNPRSPCGERRIFFCAAALELHFNPRSPCGERQWLM